MKAPRFKIGELRSRVTLQRRALSQSATGASTETWLELASARTSIETLSGSESIAAEHELAELTHRVQLRANIGAARSAVDAVQVDGGAGGDATTDIVDAGVAGRDAFTNSIDGSAVPSSTRVLVDVRPEDRLKVSDGRTLQIVSVSRVPEGRARWLVLECRELLLGNDGLDAVSPAVSGEGAALTVA